MRRTLCKGIAVLITLVGLGLLPASGLANGPIVKVTQVDPSQFPLITVYLSVTDENDRPIAALRQEEFQLFEDGQPVEVVDFAGVTSARPVDIVFVFDTTGSMREEIDGVKRISIAFARKLRDNNRDFGLGLVAFGDEIREVQQPDGQLTADADEFKRWISRLTADGGGDDPEIALDGLERAIGMRYRSGAQRVLILITDAPPHRRGDGTSFSRVVPDELADRLRRQSFTVYAVAYDDPIYRQVVDSTGGEFYDIDREPDFTGIIDRIGGLIASQYRITYRSKRPAYDGTRRAVEVRVGESRGEEVYVEKHLLNVRSSGLAAIVLALPLLLALILPMVSGKMKGRDEIRQPATSEGHGPADLRESEPVPTPPVSPAPGPLATAGTTCPRCGQALRPQARFCAHCGQAVAVQTTGQPAIHCPNCGRPLRSQARFCSGCGTAIR